MTTLVANQPIHITDDEFDTVVNRGGLVPVDLWARWRGPCHAVAPVLEDLVADHGEAPTVAKIDVDDNPLRRSMTARAATMEVEASESSGSRIRARIEALSRTAVKRQWSLETKIDWSAPIVLPWWLSR